MVVRAIAAILSLVGPRVPDGLGVNIHFTDPRPGEMQMLAGSGMKFVRMDFAWGATEREKGVYDFSAYDRLMAALDQHGMRALFILDYTNRHYDSNLSPHTEEGRQAMARWAAAAVKHFHGRDILWEMYNEPNIGFWRPKPNVDDYTKLALAVGRAIREAAPGEAYIGPATSLIDLPFLEACFKAGLLEYWDAVSVHPYRQNDPETVADEYRALRRLIGRYAPSKAGIPIISGEWGYSSAWGGMDDEKQGKRLPRQWLINLSNDVPLSIWYDWHDDGEDPKEPEHHFGTVQFPYHEGRDPVYDPKPAFLAARTLIAQLKNLRFNKRLAVGGPDDYVLLFADGAAVRVAAWTSSPTPRTVVIPTSPGRFRVVGHTGDARTAVTAGRQGLRVTLTDSPVYLAPERPNALLRLAAAWERLPLDLVVSGGKATRVGLAVDNTLRSAVRATLGWHPRPLTGGEETVVLGRGAGTESVIKPGQVANVGLRFSLPRTSERIVVEATLAPTGMPMLRQTSAVVVTNPVRLSLLPQPGGQVGVRVDSPSGDAFRGRITWAYGARSASLAVPGPVVEVAAGEASSAAVTLQADPERLARQGIRVTLRDEARRIVAEESAARIAVLDVFRFEPDAALPYALLPDGDAAVASELSLAAGDAPAGLPWEGARALRIDYRYEPGWKFARLAPAAQASPWEGQPRALGIWIHGDGSGNVARIRVVDSTGQTLQPGGLPLTWTGWRYVTFRLDGADSGHWGGADDGVPHHPLRLDTLFLLDNASRSRTSGTVYVAAPTLIW